MPTLRVTGLAIILFFLFSSGNGDTLQPVVITKHISAAEGLSSKTVYSIVQDPDGFLWFGTDAGAFRYDGNELKRYTVEDGLSDNEILNMYVDKRDRVWFLTYNGYLSFYLHGTIYNQTNAPFLKSTYVGGSFINAVEDNGKIWFASLKRGFICVDDTIVTTRMIPATEQELSFPILVKDQDSSLWYFQSFSLKKLDSPDSISIPEFPFASCSIDGLSDLLFLTSRGVHRLNNLKIENYLTGNNLPDYTKVVTIYYEKELNNLWICTLGSGCSLYHDGKFVETIFPKASVTGVMRDKEGNLWISTMNDGAYVRYKNNNYILNFDKASGLTDNKVYSLAVDSSDNLWLGFFNGEVEKLSGRNKKVYHLTTWNNADYLRTMSILIARDTVWCGNDGGIYYITNNNVTRLNYPDRSAYKNNYSVKQLTFDKDYNVYGAFSFNLIKVRKQAEEYYCSSVFDSIMRVFASVVDENGKFYVSTINGLIEFVPGKYVKNISADYDFSKVRILDMKIDKSGNLLLATNVSGIFVMRDSRVVQHITTNNKLSDNSCRKLWLEDSTLYIATQSGLNVFVKSNDRWIYKDEINIHHGIPDNAINDVATKGNLIYIATDGGVSIIDKRIFGYTQFIGGVFISELILDKPYHIKDSTVSFNSTVSRFIIRYSYPVFNPANRLLYRYRLRKEDGNTDWLNTSNNEIQFSSLDPGKYIFEVMPFSSAANSRISTLYINVLPMWWQTLTARVIAVIIVLLGITLIIRQWTRMQFEKRLRTLKEKQVIETERNRIASDMHDDIGADLTQITIWSNVLKNNESNSKALVQRISYLSNEVLSKMDQIIWALNSVNNQSGDLIAYLHSYAEEYLEDNEIEMQFIIQEGFPDLPMTAYQRRNIFLVVKELLHNTIKHSRATIVKISISFEDKDMIIVYQDNGYGFTMEGKSDGLGLSTMVKRMEEINSTLNFESQSLQGMTAILTINLSEHTINS